MSEIRKNFERAAIYSGSFNPVTLGHLHVIGHATKMVDKLYVAVGVNPDKTPLFTPEERIKMIEEDIAQHITPQLEESGNDCRIEVIQYQGATVDVMKELELSLYFRGIRGVKDFQDEEAMALTNADLFGEGELDSKLQDQFTQALIFTTDPHLTKVSSSTARELCRLGKDDALLRYVTLSVQQKLIAKMEDAGLRP